MYQIKCGGFYFVSYDSEVDEQIYSTNSASAKTFETLEDLDEACEKYGIQGYCVGVVKTNCSDQ